MQTQIATGELVESATERNCINMMGVLDTANYVGSL